MIELTLVRHGQPDWEPGGRAVDEPALSTLGRRQAEAAAQVLQDHAFDAIYVSPLRRARETAEPIAKALGIEPEVESWLEELRLPSMEGLTSEEVAGFFERANGRELPQWWNGMPGGESFRHFYERIVGGVEEWLDATHGANIHEDSSERIWRLPPGDRRLLIVAHQGTNAVILSHLLGIDPVPWAWLRFSSAWAGISHLATAPVAGGAVWVCKTFNDTWHMAHLPQVAESVALPAPEPVEG